MKLNRGCGQSCRHLGASFQTGTAPTAESFILNEDGRLQPDQPGTGGFNVFPAKGEIFGPFSEADGDRIFRALIEKVLGGTDDVEMSKADTIIAGSPVTVPLTGTGNRDFTRRCFEVDGSYHFGVPVWII